MSAGNFLDGNEDFEPVMQVLLGKFDSGGSDGWLINLG